MVSILKNTKISFLFYEPVDQGVGPPFLCHLKASGLHAQITDGFSYDQYIQRTKHPKFVRASPTPFFHFQKPVNRAEKIFSFLLKTKAASIETRIILNQVIQKKRLLLDLFRRKIPTLIVVPEAFQAAHGHLALAVASDFRIKTCVFSPLYYEWIGIRPVFGRARTDRWFVASQSYAKRLREDGVPKGRIKMILPTGSFLRKYMPQAFSHKKNGFSRHQRNSFIATLQNDALQDIFVSLLASTFDRLPGVDLWIKFHPSTPNRTKDKLKKKYMDENIHFCEGPLDPYLSHVRALITLSSTSALLAVARRVPVIIAHLNFFYHELDHLLQFYRCFLSVSDPDELRSVVSHLGNNSFRENLVKKQEAIRRDFFSNKKKPLFIRDFIK